MTDYKPTTEEEENLPRLQDCDTCNMHGPELPTFFSGLLDFHRASHDAMQVIAEPFIEFFEKVHTMKIELKKETDS